MTTDQSPPQAPYYALTELPERFSLDHHADIARAAYFRAERRGFAPGRELEDWLAAEAELKRRFIGREG